MVAEEGRRLFEEKFSLEQMVASYENLYVAAGVGKTARKA
jgi:hypothetical protein